MKLRGQDGPALELRPDELGLLAGLLTELADLLEAGDPADAVLRRLRPDAYPDDQEASAQFRSMTGDGARVERLQWCRAELAACDGTLVLTDPEAYRRWLQTLNDLRLAVGTRLGAGSDDEPDELDPTDPEQQPWLVYQWLAFVQDALLGALPDAAD